MYITFLIFGTGIIFGYMVKKWSLTHLDKIEWILTLLSYLLIFITVLKLSEQKIGFDSYINWFGVAMIFNLVSIFSSIFVTRLLLKYFSK